MSNDYLKKYRQALRDGDEEKANEYYRKYRGQDKQEETNEDEQTSDSEELLKDPSEMTVSEAKDYAEELENVEEFLEAEREGKDRTTLVDYLESKVE